MKKVSEVQCGQTDRPSNLPLTRRGHEKKRWKLNEHEPVSGARLALSVLTKLKKKARNCCEQTTIQTTAIGSRVRLDSKLH